MNSKNTNIIFVSEINVYSRVYKSTDIRILSLGRMLFDKYNLYVRTPQGCFELIFTDTDEIFIQTTDPRHALETVIIAQLTRWAIANTEQQYSIRYKYIVDFYCPRILENLLVDTSLNKSHWEVCINYNYEKDLIGRALQIGAGFLVANSRQRDWLLGLMTMDGSFVRRKHLRDAPNSFVAIVPMTFYMQQKPSYVDARRYISRLINHDIRRKFLLVWSGGWHEWMDIKTVIESMKIVSEKNSEIILIMGAIDSKKLRDKLVWKDALEGLQESKNIFVLESWIPFGDHVNLVRAADVSLVLSKHHIEDHISYRTRAIESVENNIPVIINKENPLLDESYQDVYGVTAGNPVEVATCILRLSEAAQSLGSSDKEPARTHTDAQRSTHLYKLLHQVMEIKSEKISNRKILKGVVSDFIRRLTRAYKLMVNT